jgi:hypothetical protein
MKNKENHLITHPLFITAVLLLLINDHILKGAYGNWLTGKLSDFAGLFVLPVIVAYLFPALKKYACALSALWFLFWKSPLSEDLIQILNSNSFVEFGRVVDYTDLIAFSILPLAHLFINKRYESSLNKVVMVRSVSLVLSFVALTSTSIIYKTIRPEGTIYIGKSFDLKVPKDTVLQRIKVMGYEPELVLEDSTRLEYDKDYSIKNIVVEPFHKDLSRVVDTIKELRFSFYSMGQGNEKLLIKEITFSDTLHLSDWRRMKKISKIYGKYTKELFAKEATKK